jgi:hypothetical protein
MKIEGSTITLEPDELEGLRWLAKGFNYWWSEERWKHEPISFAHTVARDMAREILKSKDEKP